MSTIYVIIYGKLAKRFSNPLNSQNKVPLSLTSTKVLRYRSKKGYENYEKLPHHYTYINHAFLLKIYLLHHFCTALITQAFFARHLHESKVFSTPLDAFNTIALCKWKELSHRAWNDSLSNATHNPFGQF